MTDQNVQRNLKLFGAALHAAGLAAVLAIAGTGYALAIRPMEGWKADCDARSNDLAERLKDADALRNEHARLTRLAEEVQQKAEALARCVPEEPLEAEFLSQVTAAAQASGLKLGDYRPGVIATQAGRSQLEIQLSCEGPYRGICAFLDRLASMERLSRVVQLDLAAAEPEGCSAQLTLTIFFKLTPADAKTSVAQHGGPARG